MNSPKLFDKPQIITAISGGASLFLNTVLSLLSMMFGEIDPETNLAIPNETLQLFSAVFGAVAFACIAWFVIRLITYKSRKKEYLENQQKENSCSNNEIMQ